MSFAVVAVGTIATVGGGLIAADAAKDAAKTQAKAISNASDISAEQAAQARQDVFTLFNPALQDFSAGIQQSIGALIGGQVTPVQVAAQTPTIAQAPQTVQAVQELPQVQQAEGVQQAQQVGILAPDAQRLPGIAGLIQQAVQPAIPAVQEAVAQAQQPITQQLPQAQPVAGQEQFGALPALGALQQGFQRARGDIQTGTRAAIAPLQQFADIGGQAAQQEAALSGALGPQAQQAAINAFIESPGQQFLRERQEEALLRNQAAIGGLGGGNVRTALQEQAFGIAATQQQQQLSNLASLAGRGQTAATGISQLQAQQGVNLSNLAAQLGLSEQQLLQGVGTQISNLLAQQAGGQADLRTTAGQLLANIATGQGTAQAGLAQQLGTAQAAGTLGQASAISQGVGQLANIAGQQFAQQPIQQPVAAAQVSPFITTQNPLGLTPGQGL